MLRKLSLGLLIAIALMAGFVSATVAQRSSTLAPLQPFLVDIQQTVPFSLTFTLPDTGESVTLPSELDVALSIQIRADGSISPTVNVAEVATAAITVSESQESGGELVDNLGLPYQIEVDPEIEVIQWNVSEDYAGHFRLTGEFRNLTSGTLDQYSIGISVTLYDSGGKILEAADGYVDLSEIDAGKTSPFESISFTPLQDVGRYLIQIEVR